MNRAGVSTLRRSMRDFAGWMRWPSVSNDDATIDDESFTLESLLDLAQRDEEGGLGDAPWPPHFAKQPGEPRRVQPSRARKDG